MDASNDQAVYREQLLDHFHNPRGKGQLDEAYIVSEGRNSMCGDEVDVGLRLDDNGCADVRFRGRGCSVCLASASIMVDALSGQPVSAVRSEHENIIAWLSGASDILPEHASVMALQVVRGLPARKRCVMLAWAALGQSLDKCDE